MLLLRTGDMVYLKNPKNDDDSDEWTIVDFYLVEGELKIGLRIGSHHLLVSSDEIVSNRIEEE